MVALGMRGRANSSPLHWLSALLLIVAIASPSAAAPADEPIVVLLDQAKIMQLPERATTVVIGNPLIADLSIQQGGLAVLTGKGYGSTNLIVMDKGGAVLLEKMIEVTVPGEETVVVYRGADRETYSCTPDCSRRMTLGDSPDYFDKTLAQITTRNAQAASAGALSSGH
jgi:hypothetical protein